MGSPLQENPNPLLKKKKKKDEIAAGRQRLEEYRRIDKEKIKNKPASEVLMSPLVQGIPASVDELPSKSLLPPFTPNESVSTIVVASFSEKTLAAEISPVYKANGGPVFPSLFSASSKASSEIVPPIENTKPLEHPWQNSLLFERDVEQHAHDFTEDKLLQQQAFDAPRSSTGSLAHENLSLKENFNKQEVESPDDQFSSKSLLPPFNEAGTVLLNLTSTSKINCSPGSIRSRPNPFLLPPKSSSLSPIAARQEVQVSSHDRIPSNTPLVTSNGPIASLPYLNGLAGSFSERHSNSFPLMDEILSTTSINASSKVSASIGKEQTWQNSWLSEREEFATLEQHIQDLTKEKFSLQRALDAARSLTDTLAQENLSLVDNFNQQGALINQLKVEMEKQREELVSHMVTLNQFSVERENIEHKNNSAVERSQILAKEVITLEEKVLKLRSNELKLEREAERLQNDIDSSKCQMYSMEKDHANLKSMIETLQEENKFLQEKLRKGAMEAASVSREEMTTEKDQKDASTSTADLVGSIEACLSTRQNCFGPLENIPLNTGAASGQQNCILSGSAVLLPPDELRIVNSINNLIAVLAKEKEQLTKALSEETAEAVKYRAVNMELSQKLEMQTQRLELAIAQVMAYGGAPTMIQHELQDDVEFVDEGDEMVDRVLGWIMKLFPGGASKRRTSKLL